MTTTSTQASPRSTESPRRRHHPSKTACGVFGPLNLGYMLAVRVAMGSFVASKKAEAAADPSSVSIRSLTTCTTLASAEGREPPRITAHAAASNWPVVMPYLPGMSLSAICGLFPPRRDVKRLACRLEKYQFINYSGTFKTAKESNPQ